MFLARLDRLLMGNYPDEQILESLNEIHFQQANIPEREFMQFRRLQSLIYSLRVAGCDVEAMQTEAFVGAVLFTYVNCKVAVTRCEYDIEVNDNVMNNISARLPKDLVWLTTNANLDHQRVKAFPIGITDYCGYSPWHLIIGDTGTFKGYIDEQPRTQKNLVLMNFNDSTFSPVRSHVRSLFKNMPFVTADPYSRDAAGYSRYVKGLRSHVFCLAPRGKGIDTHRIWECLYAGCIPIVQKTVALKDFSDLPIFFVDRWEDAVDENVLNRVRDEFYRKKWDLQKLTLSYWFRHVCRLLGVA